jgi:hypothetical protein
MRDVPMPDVIEEEVSTPKSNVQFKTPQNRPLDLADHNCWNQTQGPSQFSFGEVEKKMDNNETLQFNQNFG